MVSADHSSSYHNSTTDEFIFAGEPVGYVVRVGDVSLYHAGDTNVFGDMETINNVYKP